MSEIRVDTISEKTSANGVSIDGLTIKDGGIKGTGAQSLVVGSTDGTSARLVLDATNGDASGGDFPVLTADGTSLNITANNSGGDAFMTFQTNSGEDMRIGPNGKVGIGESVPLGRLHVKTADSSSGAHANADELVVEGSAHSGITIASGNSSTGTIAFADSGDELAGRIIYNHSTNAMSFGTSGVGTQWSINSDGNLLPGSSTSQGIHLGVTSAGAANLLDDYEEGTFAYTITGSTSGNLVLRSGYARGSYVKIGNLVHVDIRFETTSDNSLSGNVYWSLPFTMANPNGSDADAATAPGYIRDQALGTDARTGVYLLSEGNAFVYLIFSREGAANSTTVIANDSNTDGVMEGTISITYRTT